LGAVRPRAVPVEVLAPFAPRPPCRNRAPVLAPDRALRHRARRARARSRRDAADTAQGLDAGLPHRARTRPALRRSGDLARGIWRQFFRAGCETTAGGGTASQ